jgi:hypothetical protein
MACRTAFNDRHRSIQCRTGRCNHACSPHRHNCDVDLNLKELKEQRMSDIKWLSAPEPHDYPNARGYVLLLLAPKEVDDVLARLEKAEITFFKAKDILRASRLKPLSDVNPHVSGDLKKINKGKAFTDASRARKSGHLNRLDHRRRLPPRLCRLLRRRGC